MIIHVKQCQTMSNNVKQWLHVVHQGVKQCQTMTTRCSSRCQTMSNNVVKLLASLLIVNPLFVTDLQVNKINKINKIVTEVVYYNNLIHNIFCKW